ncbi:MAG: hypothetical protein C5B54_03745 [Acidobacteria bacterium]|nr:MAG: hypothetical protein C5B54_03745 [Acidobacteriota bacterium]
MADWLKRARDLQLEDELKKSKQKEEKERQQRLKASEGNWMERVNERISKIGEEYVFIGIAQAPKGVQLTGRGTVEIQFQGHENFTIKYFNILKPTMVVLTRPIRTHHHRLARVREMNDHNIEEILKFVALGMDEYTKISSIQRIERNLETLIESMNVDERADNI